MSPRSLLWLALFFAMRRSSVIGVDTDYKALEKKLKDTAAADDAAREKRKQEANDKLDDWGKAVDHVIPGGGTYIAKLAKLALAIEGAVVRWVQGDWNSDEQKARALNAVKDSLLGGMPPRGFDGEIDFAKTYADDIYGDLDKARDLQAPWDALWADYVNTLHAHADDSLVASTFAGASGSFSREFGAPFLCGAIAAVTGVRNKEWGPKAPPPPQGYGPANLLAALATARFGSPLADNLATAYAALAKLIPSHPSICDGRGYKGDPNTWDYDHGPVLYVLQAWNDLTVAPHAAPPPIIDVAFSPPSPAPAPAPAPPARSQQLRRLAPLLVFFL